MHDLSRPGPVPAFSGADVLLMAALAVPAAAYLLLKVVTDALPIDFVFLWWAGELWSAGVNPYSPAFRSIDPEIFDGYVHILSQYFFYPPHWWPISRGLALLPLEPAFLIWRVAGALCIVGGGLLLARTVRQTMAPVSGLRLGLFALYAGASGSTAAALSVGQVTPLIFLGLCLFSTAWLRRSVWMMALGLALLSLKPNIGLAFWVLAASQRANWRSLIWASGAILVAALPALLPYGPVAVVQAYLAQLGHFGDLSPNAPAHTTGLRTLIWAATGTILSPTVLALAAAALAGVVGLRADTATVPGRAAVLCLVLSVTLLCLALHSYDALLLAPLILLCRPLAAWVQLGIAAGLLVIFRAGNLVQVFVQSDLYGELVVYDSVLISVACLMLAALATAGLRRGAADAGRPS